MSDSDDDVGVALPRQKSIFSTMGRVRNMNQLREKWTARGKQLSSSSDLTSEASVSTSHIGSSSSSALPAAAQLAATKKLAGQDTTSTSTHQTAATTTRPPEPPPPPPVRRRALSAVEQQRFDALSVWIKRNGIDVSTRDPATTNENVFDDIYDSLDDLEAAVKQDLAQLLPKWRTATPAAATALATTTTTTDGHTVTTATTTTTTLTSSKVPRLVDYMVVISADLADLATHAYWYGQQNVYEASVVFAYPPQCQFNAECIEQFCFPHGISPNSPHSGSDGDAKERGATSDDFFVLVLSGGGDQGQSVQYACCLRTTVRICGISTSDSATTTTTTESSMVPVCYAVVVATPWIPFFYQLLRHLAERHQEELSCSTTADDLLSSVVPDPLAQHIDSLMVQIAEMEIPARGQELRFSIASAGPSLSCLRPREDCGSPETTALLLDWAMQQLLSTLSIPRIILILSLLLVEMKVIVVSKSMPLLSAGTVGLAGLLYPLAWAGPLITILPPALHEYLEAPVPLLCGVDALPSHFYLTKGTAILLMEKDEIQLHPDDVAQLGALQFPGSEELSRQLYAFAARLKLAPTEHTQVVVANFVMRRIRRQLQELLELCSRVNPCNAYACMKQEQLSLSETLFLKAFMQSQMYQKYSDDLPPLSSSDQAIVPVTMPNTSEASGSVSVPVPVPVETSLMGPLTDLFLLALTSSTARSTTKPTDEEDESTCELGGEIFNGDEQDEELRSSVSAEADLESSGSKHSTRASSKNASPQDRSRRTSPRIGPLAAADGDTTLDGRLDLLCAGDRLDFSSPLAGITATTQWHKAFTATPRDSECAKQASETESTTATRTAERQREIHIHVHKSPTTPPVFVSNPHDVVAPSQSRSMPDVLLLPAQQRASATQWAVGRSETELPQRSNNGGKAQWNPHTVDHCNVKPTRELSGAYRRATVSGPDRTKSAIAIQRTWRKRRTIRMKSSSTARAASCGAIPNATSAPTLSELHTGTVLSITDGTKHTNVLMRLSDDGKLLQWHHRQKLRDAIAVADVQVVKAQDGDIVIQTTTGDSYVFIVPAHNADHVMAFFQALHHLATTSAAPVVADPRSSDLVALSSVVSPPPPPAPMTRQESTRYETISNIHESSLQESKHSIVEGGGGGGGRGEAEAEAEDVSSSCVSFHDNICRGILVLKHGRMGRPHPKYLLCDDALQILSWADPIVTNAGFQSPQLQSLGRSTHHDTMTRTTSITATTTAMTTTATTPHAQKKNKGIRFDEIVAVRRGKQTRVFHRSTAGRSNADLCFSVVTRGRTLDIETFSPQDFALLFDGISHRVSGAAQSQSPSQSSSG